MTTSGFSQLKVFSFVEFQGLIASGSFLCPLVKSFVTFQLSATLHAIAHYPLRACFKSRKPH